MKHLSPNDVSEMKKQQPIWITLLDGSQMKVYEPQMRENKIRGTIDGGELREFELSEIESIGIKKIDPAKTLIISAAIATGILVLFSGQLQNQADDCST